MANLLVTAEDFAFGPIGTILPVCNRLVNRGHHLTFVGHGTSYQLAKRESFEVIELDTFSPSFAQEVIPLMRECDLLLSCMDRGSVSIAHKMGLPVIWLDILFWWWDEIPEYVLDVDCFIKQNTISDSRNSNQHEFKIKNLHSVGPIIDLSALSTRRRDSQALVAFGGMEARTVYRVGIDTYYPYVMTELLVHHVDLSKFDRVLFTGNERIINELGKQYASDVYQFRTLPHHEFLQELASSSVALIIPGLQTPLESFSYRVPTVFLPPSNSSQYVQLDHFIENGCGQAAVHLRDYYPCLDLQGCDTIAAMANFLKQLQIYETDKHAQSQTAKRLESFLHNQPLLQMQLGGQDAYLQRLGENGLDRTIQIIEEFISSNSERFTSRKS